MHIPIIGSDGRYHYIYKITNSLNSKFYIGKHSSIVHPDDDKYLGSGIYYTRFIKKYGTSLIKKEILYILHTEASAYQKEADIVSLELLKDPNCCNMKVGGLGGMSGYIISDETRDKMSRAQSGKIVSSETRRKLSLANKGKTLSTERKNQISESQIGRITSKETKKKISCALKGRKGKPLSENQKRQISKVHKGKTLSEETRSKMSNARKGLRNKAIYQYDLDMTLLKIFKSIKEVNETLGFSRGNISAAASGKYNSHLSHGGTHKAYKYLWFDYEQ